MTPKYALSLSFEGISLLVRQATGWTRRAEVALDDPELETALARMRAEVPGDGAVRLVIPNEQIRFVDLEDPGGDDAARGAAARAALEGATPYAVSELVVDWHISGTRLYVAAVARETLAEAEAFAEGHGFVPAAHVARPPKGQFPKEVLFGAPEGWSGPAPQRDMLGLVLTGAPKPVAATETPAPTDATATPPPGDVAPSEAAIPPTEDIKSEASASREANTPEAPVAAESFEAGASPSEGVALPEAAVPPTEDIEAEAYSSNDANAPEAPVAAESIEAEAPVADDAERPAPNAAETDSPTGATEDAVPPLLGTAPSPQDESADAQATTAAPVAGQLVEDAPTTDPVAEASDPPSGRHASNGDAGADAAPQTVAATGAEASDTQTPAPSEAPRDAPSVDAAPAVADAMSPEEDDATKSLSPGAASPPELPTFRVPQADEPTAGAFSSIRAERAASLSAPRDGPRLGAATAPAGGTPERITPVPATDAPKRQGSMGIAAPAVQGPLDDAPPEAPEKTSALVGFFSRRQGAKPAVTIDTAKRRSSAATPPKVTAPMRAKALARTPVRDETPEQSAPAMTSPAGGAAMAAPRDERERMTIFGARNQEGVGGKPRFLGLMLTAALLLFLAGVAAWASVFLDNGLARFFDGDRPTAVAALPEVTEGPVTPEATPDAAPEPDVQVAALDTPLVPAAQAPLSAVDRPGALSEDQADATYAATGIWQRAPEAPADLTQTEVDDVYVASIDPDVEQFDAVALPQPQQDRSDQGISAPRPSIGPGVTFDLDERGMVRATPEGALNPDGVRIFSGLPPVVAPNRPADARLPTPEGAGPSDATTPESNPLSDTRPTLRPDDLVEQNERATLTGISRNELAAMRPRLRPATEKQEAEAQAPDATDLAVTQSRSPIPRPRNFAAIVRRAEPTPAPEPTQVAAVAPRIVAPRIPSTASVSREATTQNAINLRRVNLIGVFGKTSSRRALVRLSNGRYQKVEVGDRVDGGRVTAIGESELRYRKGGRNVVLKMPSG